MLSESRRQRTGQGTSE